MTCNYCGSEDHGGECEPSWTPRNIVTGPEHLDAQWKLVKEKFGTRTVRLPDGRVQKRPSIQRKWVPA